MKKFKLTLSPSQAKRWMKCTMSPHLLAENEDKIESSDTKYNIEGRCAHKVVELLFKNRKVKVGRVLEGGKVTKKMLEHGQEFIDLVVETIRNYCKKYKPDSKDIEITSELKVKLWYMEGRHGYIDASAIVDNIAFIFDYKYGEGVSVSAADNEQMAIYAYSLLSYLGEEADNIEDFEMYIYQPRSRDENPVSIWRTTRSELSYFALSVEAVAKKILSGKKDLRFAPSDETCQFCEGVSFCPARTSQLLEVVPDGQLTLTPVDQLDRASLVKVFRYRNLLKKFIDECCEALYAQTERGDSLETKLVAGRGQRTWEDEEEAGETLRMLIGDEAIEHKVLSPAKAEKLLDPEDFESLSDLITKTKPKPVLALSDDPRPQLVINVSQEFEDYDGETLEAELI